MDEVNDIQNVARHIEYEKLHFPILMTIVLLCERAVRRPTLDVRQRTQGAGHAGLTRAGGLPSTERHAM